VTVDGLVEAGDSLLVSGGTTDSLEVEGGVIITKLLFRTKRHAVHGFTLDDEGDMIDDDGFLIEVDEFGVPVLDADDPVLVPMSDEGGFLLDVFGSIIDENGNLVALDGNGDPVVDEFENPVPAEDMFGDPIPGGPSAYVRGGGAIYISTVDEIENFVNRDGYLLDENGSLIDDGAFSGGVPQLVNNAGEVVDSEGFRLDDTGRRIDVQGYLINTDGEHVDEGGMVISTEAALLLGSRTPAPTSGKVSFGLPDSQSGGTLNATGTGSRIDVHGDAFVDVHGMIGRVELDALLEVTSVTTHEVAITSEVDVGAWGDALINAKDLVEITAEDIWLMDESVTKARDEHSVSRLTATGTTEGSGGVFIARSQVYLFRALVAAGGLVEISGQEIGVHGTISVVGPALNGDGAPALVDLDSDIGIYVSGEILSGSDVTLDAGLVDASGSILIELEGRIVAGNEQDGVEGDIALEAAGEVRVIAADDASNDGLVFAPPFLTQVPVFVDVVTGYRRVEDGFVLRPVVHWIPTITTEQAGFDPVQVGSEFATIETRLFQDGYWNPTTGTFREYFIQGIDYHVENLDWPGKNSGLDVAVYEGLVDGLIGRLNGIMAGEMEFGREDFLDEGDEIRTVLNERFVTVGQTQPDVDPSPEPFAEGGSVPGFANQLAGVQAAMQQGSRGLPAVPIGGVAAVRTEFSVSEMVELAREAPFELIQDAYDDSDDGKSWTELTDSEQVNAILDHLGYKKLFDVRFLSGFRREVEVAVPGGPVHELVLLDASKASLVDGLTRAQLQQQGGRVHTQVRASFVDNRLLLGGDGALVGGGTGEAVVSAALADNQVFQLTGDSDPVFDGVVVDGGFVPGIFVEDRFAPTLSGVADLASQLGLSVVMETRVEEKTYFDFWFPDGVISENFMEERGIVPEDVFRRGNRDDGDAANDNDYDEDYGTPGDPDYIPSLSERMDTILAEGGWEKVYSRDDGRGVIHRNFEGTPTVHLWEPEWMGNRRQIVPYTLDDGTDIFLRVPCGYEEYHVTAVGNDHIYEPDPPGSSPWKLQYVGDVHTYYETVGGFRQVADVLYEQEWSTLQRENQPTNPVRYDSYYSSDEDELGITDGEEGWVATYIADTGYDEYSIFDGRQADDHGVNGRFELFETLITRTGPIFAEFDGEPGGGAGDGAGAAVLNLELLSPEIIAGLVDLDVSTGGSVIKYWDKPPEWDISDDANNANGSNRGSVGTSGGIVGGFEGGNWVLGRDSLGQLVYGQHNPGDDATGGSGGGAAAEGGGAGGGVSGLVVGQYFVDEIAAAELLAKIWSATPLPVVAQEGVTLEELTESPFFRPEVGSIRWYDYRGQEYYVTNLTYNWDAANSLAQSWGDGDWQLAVVDSASENNTIRGLIGSTVWLGADEIYSSSPSSFRVDWVDGTHSTQSSGYANFRSGEPNNAGTDEDYLEMYTDGTWNDNISSKVQKAVFEHPVTDWGDPGPIGEFQYDRTFKAKWPWQDIKDVRSDITYLAFTEAFPIVGKRPRYETRQSNVPVIKFEQVTNWRFEPVLGSQEAGFTTEAVFEEEPADLSVFDLETLTASGDVTILAGGEVFVQASVDAHGSASGISIESQTSDVTIGEGIEPDATLADLIFLRATRSIEITAAGSVVVGDSAELSVIGESGGGGGAGGLPSLVRLAADTGTLVVDAPIRSTTRVELQSAGDLVVTRGVRGDAGIEILAGHPGDESAGTGSVLLVEGGGAGVDLGPGIFLARGESSNVVIRAGESGGDLVLDESHVVAASLVQLEALAGFIRQTGGVIVSNAFSATALSGIIASLDVAVVETAVTSSGDIELTIGKVPRIEGGGKGGGAGPASFDVTIDEASTQSGSISIEVFGSLFARDVRALGGTDDDDVTLEVRSLLAEPIELALGVLGADGSGDVELTVEGSVWTDRDESDAGVVADHLVITASGGVDVDLVAGEVDLGSDAAGDVTLHGGAAHSGFPGAAPTSTDLELAAFAGDVEVTTSIDLVARSVTLENEWSPQQDENGFPIPYVITLGTQEGSDADIEVILVSNGTWAGSLAEAEALRVEALNTLLRAIDWSIVFPTLETPVSEHLITTVLEDELETSFVELEADEARDLAAIVEGGFGAGGELVTLADAGTIHEQVEIFLFGSFSGSVNSEPTGEEAASLTRQALELVSLLTSFSSGGHVVLSADGAIRGQGGGGGGGTRQESFDYSQHTDALPTPDVIAGTLQVLAGGSVDGLFTAVNTFQDVRTLVGGSVVVVDFDSTAELRPGAELELGGATNGSFALNAVGGLVVSQVSADTDGSSTNPADVLLYSVEDLFVTDRAAATGPALGALPPAIVAAGRLDLQAGGDLTITGGLRSGGTLGLVAGKTLGTLGRSVSAEVGSLEIEALSSVAVDGHLAALGGIDIDSAANVRLLGEDLDRGGLSITSVSESARLRKLGELEANLQRRLELLRLIDEAALRDDALPRSQSERLADLAAERRDVMTLGRLDLAAAQVRVQHAGLTTLLADHFEHPAVLEDFLGHERIDSDLARVEGERPDLEGRREGLLLERQEIAGTADGLRLELADTQNAIAELDQYRPVVVEVLGNVGAELRRRGIVQPPTPENPVDLPGAFGAIDLSGTDSESLLDWTDEQLLQLFVVLVEELRLVDSERRRLTVEESRLQGQIQELQGPLENAEQAIGQLVSEAGEVGEAFLTLEGVLPGYQGTPEAPSILDLEQQLAQKETEFTLAGLEITELDREILADESELATHLDEHGRLTEILDALNVRMGIIEAQIRELDAELEAIPARLADIDSALELAEARIAELRARIAELQAALAGPRAELAALQEQLAPYYETVQPLLDQLEQLRPIIASLVEQISEVDASIEPLSAQIADLGTELTSIVDQLPLTAQLIALEEALVESLELELGPLQEERFAVQAEIDRVDHDLACVAWAIDLLGGVFEEIPHPDCEQFLAFSLPELDQLKELLELQREEFLLQLADLETRIGSLEVDRDAAKERIVGLQRSQADLLSRQGEIEELLPGLERQLASLLAQRDSLLRDLEGLEAQEQRLLARIGETSAPFQPLLDRQSALLEELAPLETEYAIRVDELEAELASVDSLRSEQEWLLARRSAIPLDRATLVAQRDALLLQVHDLERARAEILLRRGVLEAEVVDFRIRRDEHVAEQDALEADIRRLGEQLQDLYAQRASRMNQLERLVPGPLRSFVASRDALRAGLRGIDLELAIVRWGLDWLAKIEARRVTERDSLLGTIAADNAVKSNDFADVVDGLGDLQLTQISLLDATQGLQGLQHQVRLGEMVTTFREEIAAPSVRELERQLAELDAARRVLELELAAIDAEPSDLTHVNIVAGGTLSADGKPPAGPGFDGGGAGNLVSGESDLGVEQFQDAFSGYHVHRHAESGELFYRDAHDVEDPAGAESGKNPLDDTFYRWQDAEVAGFYQFEGMLRSSLSQAPPSALFSPSDEEATGLTVDPGSLDFRAVPIDDILKREVEVKNTSGRTLSISSISLDADTSPDFEITSNPGAGNVVHGATFKIEVTYTARDEAPDSGAVRIGIGSGDESIFAIIPLTGSGVFPEVRTVFFKRDPDFVHGDPLLGGHPDAATDVLHVLDGDGVLLAFDLLSTREVVDLWPILTEVPQNEIELSDFDSLAYQVVASLPGRFGEFYFVGDGERVELEPVEDSGTSAGREVDAGGVSSRVGEVSIEDLSLTATAGIRVFAANGLSLPDAGGLLAAPSLDLRTFGVLEAHGDLRALDAGSFASGGDLILGGEVSAGNALSLNADFQTFADMRQDPAEGRLPRGFQNPRPSTSGRVIASTSLPSASQVAALRSVGIEDFFTPAPVTGDDDAPDVCEEEQGLVYGLDLLDGVSLIAPQLRIISLGSVYGELDVEGLILETRGLGDVVVLNRGEEFAVQAAVAGGRFDAFSLGNIAAQSIVTQFAGLDSSVSLRAAGTGSLRVGEIVAGQGESAVFLDAALGVEELGAEGGSVVRASGVQIDSGLAANLSQQLWSAGPVTINDDLSVFIDADFAAEVRGQGAEIGASRDIFVGAHVALDGAAFLGAGRDVVFLEGTSLTNHGGTTQIMAGGSLHLLGGVPLGGGGGAGAGGPSVVIDASHLVVESGGIRQHEDTLLRSEQLDLEVDPFGIRSLDAQIETLRDLPGISPEVVAGLEVELEDLRALRDSRAERDVEIFTDVRSFRADNVGRGDLLIHSAGDVDLEKLDVHDGTISVETTGSMRVQNLSIHTDRHANGIDLRAHGDIAIEAVELGPNVRFAASSSSGSVLPSLTGMTLEGRILREPVYVDAPATLEIELLGDARALFGSSESVRFEVDLGDGTGRQLLEPGGVVSPPQIDTLVARIDTNGGTLAGRAVAGVGDANGDGLRDLLVAESLVGGSGQVRLLAAESTGGLGGTVWVHTDAAKGTGFGEVIAAAGDINGDGLGDWLVSAPRSEEERTVSVDDDGVAAVETLQGAVFVYLGSTQATGIVSNQELMAGSPGARFGGTLAAAGDVDGDGYGDILVGADHESRAVIRLDGTVDLLSENGVVQMWRGSAAGVRASTDWTASGLGDLAHFGAALGSGDVNGDGFSDVVVGAPGDGADLAGRIHVFHGSSYGLSGSADQVLEPDSGAAGDLLGASIAVLDLDGDGLDDIVSTSTDGTGAQSRVVIFLGSASGISPEPDAVLDSHGGIDGFAHEVAAAGDFDGDGRADLLVRVVTPSEADAADGALLSTWLVYLGSPDGVDPSPARLGPAVDLDASLVGFTPTAAALGDLDGDGRSEVALALADAVTVHAGAPFEFEPTLIARASIEHVYTAFGDYEIVIEATAPDGNGAVDRLPISVEVDIPRVVDFTPTPSGFVVELSRPIQVATLDLHGDEAGGWPQPDVVLRGERVGEVSGSLVVDADGRRLSFVATGGVLAADDYRATLRSGTDAFVGFNGRLLDGDGDRVGGDDFTADFRFGDPDIEPLVVGIADAARGPGQTLDADGEGSGLAVTISEATGISSVSFVLRHDPDLLVVTDARPGANLPKDAAVTVTSAGPGVTAIDVTSDTGLGSGALELVSIEARVPHFAALGAAGVLDLDEVRVVRSDGQSDVAIDDDGVHAVSYLGDADGDGSYGSADAQKVLRVSVGLDDGFAAHRLVDPVVVADVNGSGALGTQDARAVLRTAVGLDSEIPGIPAAARQAAAGEGGGAGRSSGTEYRRVTIGVSSGAAARPGETVSASVSVDAVDRLTSADLVLGYDAAALAPSAGGVRAGSLMANALLEYRVDARNGRVIVAMATLTPGTGSGELLELELEVLEGAVAGESLLDLQRAVLDGGAHSLSTRPIPGADATDGSVTILEPNRAPLIESVGDLRVDVGEKVSFKVVARDPDGPDNLLFYRLQEAPAGAWIDAKSGVFTWTPTALDAGLARQVTVVVGDAEDPVAESRMSFSVEVLKVAKIWTFGVDWNLGVDRDIADDRAARGEKSPQEAHRAAAYSQPFEETFVAVTARNEPLFDGPFYDSHVYDGFYHH